MFEHRRLIILDGERGFKVDFLFLKQTPFSLWRSGLAQRLQTVKVGAVMASCADVSLHGAEGGGRDQPGSYYQLALPAFHWTAL